MKLLVAFLLALCVGLCASTARAQTPHACDAQAGPPSAIEQAVVDQNNAYRLSRGLAPLIYDADLARTAQWKAQEMAASGDVEHNDPFRTWEQRFVDCGFTSGWMGENLAAGLRRPEEVEAAWQASPHHNENLLRPEFHRIAVAEADGVGPYGRYWAMELAGGGDQ